MIYRTAAVCLALTATFCTAQEQAQPLAGQGTPAEQSVPGDPVLLPDMPTDLIFPEISEPAQDGPAQDGAPIVTDVSINPDLAQAVPLTLIGRDSRDGNVQSQLLLSNGAKPGQVRVVRNVTLADGSIASQEGIGRVRGDKIKVKLDAQSGLADLMASEALEPVNLSLRLNRSTGVVSADGVCKTHEFTAQGTDSGQLAPLLDANQGRTRTFMGRLKARFKGLMAKIKTMFLGTRAKISAWRAKRAAKRAGNASEAAIRHRERAEHFADAARGEQQATPVTSPIAIQRPAINGPGQALPPAVVVDGPGHGAQQGVPSIDAPLAQTGVQAIPAEEAKPEKRGNVFSRTWRRLFKRSER